jgi:hypothetical protein
MDIVDAPPVAKLEGRREEVQCNVILFITILHCLQVKSYKVGDTFTPTGHNEATAPP